MAKKCTSCAKDLPDSAPFCAFCGAKQAMAPAAGPAPGANAKTVLGYSAADLLKNLPPAGAPRPGAGAPPPQQFAPPPAAPPQQFAPPPQQFGPPPQQFAPPPAAPPQQFAPPPQQFAPPPPAQGGQFGGSATAATMFMQNAPQIPVQPAQPAPQAYQPPQPMPPAGGGFPPPPMGQQGGGFPPPPMGQPGGYPPPQQPGGYPPPQQPMGMPGGGMPMANPYGGQPMGAPGQPPFLASQTAARLDKPVEPFNDMTKLVLLVFGGCLLGFLLVPLSLKPFAMMVTAIGDLPGSMKLIPILVGLGGVGGVLLATMPMPAMQRGLFAAALGVVPILLFSTVLMGGFAWQMVVFPIGGILVPTGLLLRDAYPTEKLPRLFVFAGAACIVVPFFVPFRVVDMVLDILKSLVHPGVLIALLGGFVPLLLSAIAVILCLIPGRFKFGAKQIAWAWFTFPLALMIAQLTVNGSIVDVLTKQPGMLFSWTAMQLPSKDVTANATFALPLFTAFAAFATWGLATLFGKQLEMSK